MFPKVFSPCNGDGSSSAGRISISALDNGFSSCTIQWMGIAMNIKCRCWFRHVLIWMSLLVSCRPFKNILNYWMQTFPCQWDLQLLQLFSNSGFLSLRNEAGCVDQGIHWITKPPPINQFTVLHRYNAVTLFVSMSSSITIPHWRDFSLMMWENNKLWVRMQQWKGRATTSNAIFRWIKLTMVVWWWKRDAITTLHPSETSNWIHLHIVLCLRLPSPG